MRAHAARLCLTLVIVLACFVPAVNAQGRDPDVYDNLKRSRDALLDQQTELQRAYHDVRGQIDRLQQRLNRIDQYMRQVNTALSDVEAAMRQAR